MKHESYVNRTFSTDSLMRGLWLNLHTDLKRFLDPNTTGYKKLEADRRYITANQYPTYRSCASGLSYWQDHYSFKVVYQMETLFKRYRFKHDLYSDNELLELTYGKFRATQDRISAPIAESPIVDLVYKKAADIISKALGSYDIYEHFNSCCFGKRAAVGLPRRNSYLDERIRNLTGSQDHIEWFKNYLNYDETLRSAIYQVPFVAKYMACDVLGMTVVPKNHKSLRTILANTVIGGFYTAGLGAMFERRLRSLGIDIRFQQNKHRFWIKKYSKSLTHVTADLSAASDSFTDEHLRRLLPRDWYQAVVYGAVRKVDCNGEIIDLKSIILMGLGHTFPLQTLLFYALLRAVKELLGCSGRISVFGDDLIYPTSMHKQVRKLFELTNFQLNDDKTFVEHPFRESCGEDFHSGVNVRPFSPEGATEDIKAPAVYEAHLYKVINGLLRRWSADEIPITYRFLISEVLRVADVVKQVPPSFPDYSGVKTCYPFPSDLHIPYSKVAYTKNGNFHFQFLALLPRYRYVQYQYIYMWNRLRIGTVDETERYWDMNHTLLIAIDGTLVWIPEIVASEMLFWRRARFPARKMVRGLCGKRLRRLAPFVPSKTKQPEHTTTSTSIPVWN